MAAGYECGISFDGYNDIKVGDIIVCYILEQIERFPGVVPLPPGLRAGGAQGLRGTCGLAGVLLPWHDRCHGSPVWCSFMLLVLGKTAIRR